MKKFENMFEGYEFKSMKYQNKLQELGLVNDENRDILTDLFLDFLEVEQLMLMYKTQKEHVEYMRDMSLKK